jgi:hypothetical protein
LDVLLFQHESNSRKITLHYKDAAGLTVSAGAELRVLQPGTDFVCTTEGVQLLEPTQKKTSVFSVASKTETTRHTLSRTSDGDLLDAPRMKTAAVAYGVGWSGKEHSEAGTAWKAAR